MSSRTLSNLNATSLRPLRAGVRPEERDERMVYSKECRFDLIWDGPEHMLLAPHALSCDAAIPCFVQTRLRLYAGSRTNQDSRLDSP